VAASPCSPSASAWLENALAIYLAGRFAPPSGTDSSDQTKLRQRRRGFWRRLSKTKHHRHRRAKKRNEKLQSVVVKKII